MPRRANPVLTSTVSQPSLESLLAQASNGDREAFLEIYDRMAPRILGVIGRILGGPGSAQNEQVLEDVFAELYNVSRSLASADVSVAAWLTLRARSRALDRLPGRTAQASEASPRRRESVAGSGSMLSWLPDAGAISRIEQRRPLLLKVLGQLPHEQFKALELVIFEGRVETEVAVQLGEPLAKVKAELRAAVRFLRHRRRAVVGSWAVNI